VAKKCYGDLCPYLEQRLTQFYRKITVRVFQPATARKCPKVPETIKIHRKESHLVSKDALCVEAVFYHVCYVFQTMHELQIDEIVTFWCVQNTLRHFRAVLG
jgi:hypothetical protein